MNPAHFAQLSVREQLRALRTMTGPELRTILDLPGLNQRVRCDAETFARVEDAKAFRAARIARQRQNGTRALLPSRSSAGPLPLL